MIGRRGFLRGLAVAAAGTQVGVAAATQPHRITNIRYTEALSLESMAYQCVLHFDFDGTRYTIGHLVDSDSQEERLDTVIRGSVGAIKRLESRMI